MFPRSRELLVSWIARLASLEGLRWLVPAHYDAPLACDGTRLMDLTTRLRARSWAVDGGNWSTLGAIDSTLLRLGVVPDQGSGQQEP